MHTLGSNFKNVYNLDVILTKGTSNNDEIIIMLNNSIKSGNSSHILKLFTNNLV